MVLEECCVSRVVVLGFTFVLLEGLSLPICLSEGSELGSCVVAIFETCSAAPVVEGDLLGSGCVACACPVLPPYNNTSFKLKQ